MGAQRNGHAYPSLVVLPGVHGKDSARAEEFIHSLIHFSLNVSCLSAVGMRSSDAMTYAF